MTSDLTRYHTPIDRTDLNTSHALMLDLAGTGQRILELGCATGHLTEHLVEDGHTVVGLDIDPLATESAGRFAERVHIVDLDIVDASSVESERFDVILAGDVLEHLRDPSHALRDLVTLLKPGGRVVVSIPNVSFIDVRLMLLEGRWTYQDLGLLDRTHLRWFTREGLRDLLASAGLTATDVRRVVNGIGGAGLDIHPELHSRSVLEQIEADPEAHTFQFVVEAVRTAELDDPVDPLAPTPIEWPRPDDALLTTIEQQQATIDELRQGVDAQREAIDSLQAEVDAWRRSKLVRLTAPVRAVAGRARRALGS